jgi:hypothetical protein
MPSEEQKAKNLKGFEAALAAGVQSKGLVALNGTYTLAKLNPIKGRWYFAVQCLACGKTTPILPDESNGQRGNPFTGTGKIRVECHHCSKEIEAGRDEFVSLQW